MRISDWSSDVCSSDLAIVGSMERFIGVLIENYAGSLPTWLAPVQAVVMNITDTQADWVREVRKTLANQGFRVSGDLRNEKIGYKIREHTLQRVPYLLVVGDREKDNGAVAVRTRSGDDLGTMSVADFAARLADGHAAAYWWSPVHGLDGRAPAGPSAEADGKIGRAACRESVCPYE